MSTPNRPQCTVDGRDMYYKINDIRNVTENKVVKSGFETKFLIDTVKAIRGQCFNVHQQCKGLYPVVDGKEAGKNWLTSIDQDNDISLQHTLDKSDIPILYNTPRFCDPGITKSRNWSLKNYIQTRLFMYNNSLKNGSNKFTNLNRNSRSCYDSVVFDFRPFTFSMELPGESNAITRTNTPAKKIYITQWMEFNPKSEYGFSPNTSISDQPYTLKGIKSSLNFFKELVGYYSKKGFGSGTPTEFNNSKPIKIGNTNKDIEDFISFIKKYDGVGFAGANNNSNVVLPELNSRKGILNLKLEDDVIRMFFFDLIHDLGKSSPKFKALTYGQFKRRFVAAVDELKGGHLVSGFKTGAGTTAKSYEQYETLVQKRNTGNANEVPAIFKTIGDLSQYIYAAKYNTTVASGDRMGIAVGLYVCAKMGVPVKCMIEDGITGFVLYTGRDRIQFTQKSSCKGGNRNGGGACLRNSNTSISGGTIENRVRQFSPNVAKQMDMIETQKPKLPPNMKSLTTLWSGAANVLNVNRIDDIVRIVNDFQGYWSNTDLNKLIQIINTIRSRSNVNNSRKIRLSELNGKLRAYLKNNTQNR